MSFHCSAQKELETKQLVKRVYLVQKWAGRRLKWFFLCECFILKMSSRSTSSTMVENNPSISFFASSIFWAFLGQFDVVGFHRRTAKKEMMIFATNATTIFFLSKCAFYQKNLLILRTGFFSKDELNSSWKYQQLVVGETDNPEGIGGISIKEVRQTRIPLGESISVYVFCELQLNVSQNTV